MLKHNGVNVIRARQRQHDDNDSSNLQCHGPVSESRDRIVDFSENTGIMPKNPVL